MELLERLNRTMKMALDDGTASSVEMAEQLFQSFHVQLVVGREIVGNRPLQATLLTLLNAAPRTFLGDVTVSGELDVQFDIGWYQGETVRTVAARYGVTCTPCPLPRPTLLIGGSTASIDHMFKLHVALDASGFVLSPDGALRPSSSSSIAAGVAAAGVALNECFQFQYFRRAYAGQRVIRFSLPGGHRPTDSANPTWVVGLGHVGQAFLWCAALNGGPGSPVSAFYLQDFDRVTLSGISTGLLTDWADVGFPKAEIAAAKMAKAGFLCTTVLERAEPAEPPPACAKLCIVAVDSYGFRRQLDKLRGCRIIEGGIGDGTSGFTQIQVHELPGRRSAADIWCGDDPVATRRISLGSPAYQNLLRQNGDECGTTQLAGRSVATPFVGAFLGAIMYASAYDVLVGVDSMALDVNVLQPA